MKKLLFFTFILLIAYSCGRGGGEEKVQMVDANGNMKFDMRTAPANSLLHILGDTLVTMKVVNEKTTNPYERYGLEFMGHCYACDLANIVITSNSLLFENACQTGVKKEYPYRMIEDSGDRFVVITEKVSFIFERIDEAPIYKLTLKGEFEEHKDLRINEFFTTKTALSKFEIHDCGDFDG